MTTSATTELLLVRHAPAENGGRLCGRRDVPARLDDRDVIMRLAGYLAGCTDVVSSPALRCRQTARLLFPEGRIATDPRLWEQDFGAHEGRAPHELPDLGVLDRSELADLVPPGGESFAGMTARVAPALHALARRATAARRGPVAVIAHAGTVRAGLALALGNVPAALAFEVAPLSLTRLRYVSASGSDAFSIICANLTV